MLRRSVLGIRLDVTSYAEAVELILDWAMRRESGYVCAAPVATIMQARDSLAFRRVLDASNLTTPDGTPVVWTLRIMGERTASRVYGPDLMIALLKAAERDDLPIGFYGGTERAVRGIRKAVQETYPRLRLVYAFSPPFRRPTLEEDAGFVEEINASGARILFVGIGSPRQETWMFDHREMVHSVMVGVGAAFDYLAGEKPQAPGWMRKAGLEWLFRLMCEPRRLLLRNIKHNPRYLALVAWQLSGLKRFE